MRRGLFAVLVIAVLSHAVFAPSKMLGMLSSSLVPWNRHDLAIAEIVNACFASSRVINGIFSTGDDSGRHQAAWTKPLVAATVGCWVANSFAFLLVVAGYAAASSNPRLLDRFAIEPRTANWHCKAYNSHITCPFFSSALSIASPISIVSSSFFVAFLSTFCGCLSNFEGAASTSLAFFLHGCDFEGGSSSSRSSRCGSSRVECSARSTATSACELLDRIQQNEGTKGVRWFLAVWCAHAGLALLALALTLQAMKILEEGHLGVPLLPGNSPP